MTIADVAPAVAFPDDARVASFGEALGGLIHEAVNSMHPCPLP